jgi:uncharacterized membrane protein YkvA (DUF1232 family)
VKLKVPHALAKALPSKDSDWKQAGRRLGQHIQYYRGIYKDKRTPLRAKIMLGIALAYLFSPFDLIPDFIPVLGQIDDIVVVPFLFNLANRAVPPAVKAHWQAKYLDE